MNMFIKLTLAIFNMCSASITSQAADNPLDIFQPRPENVFRREVKAIYAQYDQELFKGTAKPDHLAKELAALSLLADRYRKEFPEDVAELLFQVALLHHRRLNDPDRTLQLLNEVKRDFPETRAAKKAILEIETLPKMVAGEKIRASLKVGVELPGFSVLDTEGQPLELKTYRGKVVLLVFSTVDSGPLWKLKLLPTYQRHHDSGFEIIWINMDDSIRLPEALRYIKAGNLPGRHYAVGKDSRNDLVLQYGVASYRDAILLDRAGRIVLLELPTFSELETAIVQTLKQ